MAISDELVQFGLLTSGQEETAFIALENRGSTTLDISQVIVSCGCTRVSLERNEVAPGASTRMRITASGTGVGAAQLNTIDVLSNDPTRPKATIQVIVHPMRTSGFEPREIDFGRRESKTLPATEMVTLQLAPAAPIKVAGVTAASDLPHVACEIIGWSEAEQTVTIFVTLGNDAPAGEMSGRLTVRLPGSEREHSASIVGCVLGDYFAQPAALVIGPLRESDKPRVETIRIAARGAQNNEFSLLASGGNHWPVAGLQVSQGDPGQANEFTLTCDPRLWPAPWTSQRVRTSIQVKLTSNEGAEARLNIPVEVVLDR